MKAVEFDYYFNGFRFATINDYKFFGTFLVSEIKMIIAKNL